MKRGPADRHKSLKKYIFNTYCGCYTSITESCLKSESKKQQTLRCIIIKIYELAARAARCSSCPAAPAGRSRTDFLMLHLYFLMGRPCDGFEWIIDEMDSHANYDRARAAAPVAM